MPNDAVPTWDESTSIDQEPQWDTTKAIDVVPAFEDTQPEDGRKIGIPQEIVEALNRGVNQLNQLALLGARQTLGAAPAGSDIRGRDLAQRDPRYVYGMSDAIQRQGAEDFTAQFLGVPGSNRGEVLAANVEATLGPEARGPQAAMRDRQQILEGAAADIAKEGAALPQGSAELQNFKQTDNWLSAWAKDPVRITAAIIGESLPVAAPSMAAGAVAGPGGIFAGSASTEYVSALGEVAAKAGLDLTDEADVAALFNDPSLMRLAKDRGTKRGIAIGAFDALTAGVAGRLLGKAIPKRSAGLVASATIGETAIQAAGGAAGEAVGQIATEGKITSGRDIFSEAISEVATLPAEALSNYRRLKKTDQAVAASTEPGASDAALKTLETERRTVIEESPAIDQVLAELETAPAVSVAQQVQAIKTPEEFQAWVQQSGDSLTANAYKLGGQTTTAEGLADLRQRQQQAREASQAAIAAGDLETAMVASMQGQFFREAAEWTTGTGSAGTFQLQNQPDYQPPLLDAQAREQLKQGIAEAQALTKPKQDIIQRLEDLKFGRDTTLQSAFIPGFDPATFKAVWNGALTIAQEAIKAGRSVVEAVKAGVDALRQNAGADFNETQATQQMERAVLGQPLPPTFGRYQDPRHAGQSRSTLGTSEILTTTNDRRIKHAEAFMDFHGDDLNGAIADMRAEPREDVRVILQAKILERIAQMQQTSGGPVIEEQLDRVTERLMAEFQAGGTNTAQALQAKALANNILASYAGFFAYRDTQRTQLKKVVDRRVNPEVVEDVRTGIDRAGAISGTTLEAEGQELSEPILDFIDKATPPPTGEVDQTLADRIMQMLGPLANWREKFTRRGARAIANDISKVFEEPEAEDGNINQFDRVVQQQLRAIIRETLKTIGMEQPKAAVGPTAAQQVVRFLSDDPLRGDKLEVVDELVRRQIKSLAAEHPEAALSLMETWESVAGVAAVAPTSDRLAARAVQEIIREIKPRWSYVMADPDRIVAFRTDVLQRLEERLRSLATERTDTDLPLPIGAFMQLANQMLDQKLEIRRNNYEMGLVMKAAKDALGRTIAPEQEAQAAIDRWAKLQSDTPNFEQRPLQQSVVRRASRDYLRWNLTPDGFRKLLTDAGVSQATTESLLAALNREQSARSILEFQEQQEKVNQWLADRPKMKQLLRQTGQKMGLGFRRLFSGLPEDQQQRQAQLFQRISDNPKLAGLTPANRVVLAEALNSAWADLRMDILRREFDRLIPLPTVTEAVKEKVKDALPEIVRQANLGLLDIDVFREAVGRRMGVDIRPEVSKELLTLGQQAERLPEGPLRNKKLQEIQRLLEDNTQVNPYELAKSFWYANILSGTGTAGTIFFGGAMHSMVNTMLAALDAATFLGRPDVGLRIIGDFFGSASEGARNFYDVLTTGDYSRFPEFGRKFAENMEGRFRADEFEKIFRRPGFINKVKGSPALVTRLLTGLDQFFSLGVRNGTAYYAALSRGEAESLGRLMQKWDRRLNEEAERQAEEEFKSAGFDTKRVDVLARKRQILEQGVSTEIQDAAVELGRQANLNAKPVGLTGAIYDLVSQIPFVLRIPLGATFIRSALNLVGNASDWMPVLGLVNYGRSSEAAVRWAQNLAEGVGPRSAQWVKALAPELPQEQRRLIAAKHAAGFAVVIVGIGQFLLKPHDDDEWEISGGWFGLTPQQAKTLKDSGIKPYSFWKRDPQTGEMISVSFKDVPFAAPLAMVANMRDAELYGGRKWKEQELLAKSVDGMFMGISYVAELPMLSQIGRVFGLTAASKAQNKPEDFGNKRLQMLQDALGGYTGGAVPFSSLLKDIDVFTEESVYRAPAKEPGWGYFLSSMPFARRLSSDKPEINVLGEEITQERGPISRFYTSKAMSREMAVLAEKLAQGVFPSLPGRTALVVDQTGVRRQMTDTEWRDYALEHGRLFKRVIGANEEAIRQLPPAQLLKAQLLEQLGDLSQLQPAERLQLDREIQRKVDEESADGFFRRINVEIGNAVRKQMQFEPMEIPR